MIIWGSGGDSKDLGQVEIKQCQTCAKEQPFKLLLQYRFAHLYYLFSWVTQKRYLVACDVCRRGDELEARYVEPKLEKHPIPFMKRFGWVFLVALVGGAMMSSYIR